jgi:hypothetical protein
MAKTPKKGKPTKKSSASRTRERIERRFLPLSTTDKRLLYALMTIGAAVGGAGAFSYWGNDGKAVFHDQAFYFFVVAGVLIAAALWFSGSSDAAVRVGATGVTQEQGGLRRMPWYEVESLTWAAGERVLTVIGKDESGSSMTLKVKAKAHPQACAWIVHEMRARLPKLFELDEDAVKDIGEADEHAGTKLNVPLHVVGKRCAASGKTITYEPDARVCSQCERVYHKHKVPKVCACGNDLRQLRDQVELYEEDEDA